MNNTFNKYKTVDIRLMTSDPKTAANAGDRSWRHFLPNSLQNGIGGRLLSGGDSLASMLEKGGSFGSGLSGLIRAGQQQSSFLVDGLGATKDSSANEIEDSSYVNSTLSKLCNRLNVLDNVVLCAEELPYIQVQNSYKAALDTLSSSFKVIGGSDKLGGIISKAGKASVLYSGVDKALQVGSGILAGSSSTENTPSTVGTLSLNPWITKVRAYDGTEPIKLSIEFKFKMGQFGYWNAREEVLIPSLNLIAPVMPQYRGDFLEAGNMPTAWGMLGKVVSDTVQGVWNFFSSNSKEENSGASSAEKPDVTEEESSSIIEAITSSFKNSVLLNNTYRIVFGPGGKGAITFNSMYMDSASIKFGRETDQFGYPTSSTVKVDFTGVLPPSLQQSSSYLAAVRFGAGF